MDDKEFIKMMEGSDNDCPEKLIKMAESSWQKQVAVEFVLVHKRINERNERFAKIESNIKWCKWLIVSVFGIAALGLLTQWIPSILPLL